MKPYRYLAISVTISVLAHLILLALLSETYLTQKEITKVFNVDIVSPPKADRALPETIIPQSVIKKTIKETPLKSQKPSGYIPLVKPETMFDDGDSKKVSEDVFESSAADKAEAGTEIETTSDDASSKISKDGFYLSRESSQYNREKIVKRGEGLSSERKVISFDTSDLKYRGYMRSLKEMIESVWKYPEDAAKQGISGELDIKFVINRNGTLGEVKTVRQSGFRELDNAAEQAVKDSFPFYPLPDGWEGTEYTVDGHFIYELGGKYVR